MQSVWFHMMVCEWLQMFLLFFWDDLVFFGVPFESSTQKKVSETSWKLLEQFMNLAVFRIAWTHKTQPF